MATIRVLESFAEPRSTTNPYITQLATALKAEPRLEVAFFSWRRALVGPYDVFHAHWPDALLAGRNPLTRLAKRLAAALLLLRLIVRRTPVVRTMHNVTPHEKSRAAGWFDHALMRRTRIRILLNDAHSSDSDTYVIPHGDYRDWYAKFPRAELIPGRIGFAGLIRPYKGVEDLVRAFRSLSEDDETVSLSIVGMPRTEKLRSNIEEGVAKTPRTSVTFAYVTDEDLVNALTEAELVALPYHHMTNSGAALAALSLDRHVLLPRVPAAETLQAEVGATWVTLFDGPLLPEHLGSALRAAKAVPAGAKVAFHDRDWKDAGTRHWHAFSAALGHDETTP
ncbi:glycosyltransferase [Microbacterium sp. KR10-403]|uniref:glycosyltransferase n=1 Tax=Microbacterium sp. KR10-403 TaxID=3158581 RepID=UPI0032E4EDF4